MITYSSITITDLEEASQFWTTSQDPTTPDYTFTIANLTGDTNADIKVGDIIFHSHYRYMVLSVGTTTVRAGDRVSIKGADAISPTIKSIVCSHAAAVCGKDGTYNPTTIQFSGQTQQGETIGAYNGYFVIDISSDGNTWVRDYASTTKATSTNYTIPLGVNISKNGVIYPQGTVSQSGTVLNTNFTITSEGVVTTTEDVGFIIRSIRCSLYADYDNLNQTYSNLVDQQRINIAFDGVDGNKGDDAYSVTLTNENYTFSGNTTSAVASNISTGFNVAECNVIAYYGGVQIPCYIGTITGMPTGMDNPNNSITGQNSNNAKFAVTVTNTMETQNGVLNIPVILNKNTTDEKTFNMKFSYSLKLNGLDSTGLGLKVNYSNLSTVANGKCVYYAFEDGTKQPVIDNNVNGWVMWNGQEILIPTGCYINPLATMPTGQTIYSVYRLNNASNPSSGGVFHDVTWTTYTDSNAGQLSKWESNTYSGSVASKDLNTWVWDEDKDIILAMYVLKENSSAITNAQLFSPPKKYSELAEPAKTMAIDARKHATNYLSIDSTGVMVANMTDGNTYEPSEIPTGNKNVLITDFDVKIRDGQTQLASYGNIIKLGKYDENNIQITSNTFKGVKTIHGASTSTDIEVFNMTVGDNRVVELSDVAQKQEGSSSVSVTLYPSHEFNEQDTLTMYGIILFEDGVSRETQRFNRQYDANDDSGEIIGDIIEFTWLDDDGVRQTLSCSLDYMLNNTTSTFYANDTYTTEKISSIQLALVYVEDESYPYYRFGIHNSDDIFYDEGNFSFDIGENNVVAGSHAFAHGTDNSVQGVCGFANGNNCSVTGDYANANGKDCVAQGDYSTVNGVGNVARYEGQTVIGKYAHLSTSDDLFIVGNGTSESDRSYAMRLKNDGRVEFKGAVGTGLAWGSRTEMINAMKNLSLNIPYQFYASSVVVEGNTIYWGTTAKAEAQNAFGTICRVNPTTWKMFYMCGDNMYRSKFTWDGTTDGTFDTKQLAFVTP